MSVSPLGDLLVSSGLLTAEDCSTIIRECGRESQAFAKSILNLGILSEVDLPKLMNKRAGTKSLNQTELLNPSHEAAGFLDNNIMRRLEVLPIAVESGRLVVAMLDPLDRDTVSQVQFFARVPVIAVAAKFSDLTLALSKQLGKTFHPAVPQITHFLKRHQFKAGGSKTGVSKAGASKGDLKTHRSLPATLGYQQSQNNLGQVDPREDPQNQSINPVINVPAEKRIGKSLAAEQAFDMNSNLVEATDGTSTIAENAKSETIHNSSVVQPSSLERLETDSQEMTLLSDNLQNNLNMSDKSDQQSSEISNEYLDTLAQKVDPNLIESPSDIIQIINPQSSNHAEFKEGSLTTENQNSDDSLYSQQQLDEADSVRSIFESSETFGQGDQYQENVQFSAEASIIEASIVEDPIVEDSIIEDSIVEDFDSTKPSVSQSTESKSKSENRIREDLIEKEDINSEMQIDFQEDLNVEPIDALDENILDPNEINSILPKFNQSEQIATDASFENANSLSEIHEMSSLNSQGFQANQSQAFESGAEKITLENKTISNLPVQNSLQQNALHAKDPLEHDQNKTQITSKDQSENSQFPNSVDRGLQFNTHDVSSTIVDKFAQIEGQDVAIFGNLEHLEKIDIAAFGSDLRTGTEETLADIEVSSIEPEFADSLLESIPIMPNDEGQESYLRKNHSSKTMTDSTISSVPVGRNPNRNNAKKEPEIYDNNTNPSNDDPIFTKITSGSHQTEMKSKVEQDLKSNVTNPSQSQTQEPKIENLEGVPNSRLNAEALEHLKDRRDEKSPRTEQSIVNRKNKSETTTSASASPFSNINQQTLLEDVKFEKNDRDLSISKLDGDLDNLAFQREAKDIENIEVDLAPSRDAPSLGRKKSKRMDAANFGGQEVDELGVILDLEGSASDLSPVQMPNPGSVASNSRAPNERVTGGEISGLGQDTEHIAARGKELPQYAPNQRSASISALKHEIQAPDRKMGVINHATAAVMMTDSLNEAADVIIKAMRTAGASEGYFVIFDQSPMGFAWTAQSKREINKAEIDLAMSISHEEWAFDGNVHSCMIQFKMTKLTVLALWEESTPENIKQGALRMFKNLLKSSQSINLTAI